MTIRFSVVVPVYNNESDLERCLASLNALNYPRDQYEILVVDNNSTDATAAVAAAMDVTCLSETQFQSSYAARNAGIKAAKGEFIAFTDSDCVVDSGWLKAIDEASGDEQVGCFAGEILSVPPNTTVERFSESIGLLRQKGPLSGWHFKPYAQTANAVYRKAVFDRIGLFDPATNSGGDAAIAWRMLDQTNFKIQFVPHAIVFHHHRTSVPELYAQFRRYGGGKMSWALSQSDYQPPMIADLERDVVGQFSKHLEALENAGADEGVLFSGLKALTQAAHLSGYLQDLIRYSNHGAVLDHAPRIARERASVCNICGCYSFLPGPRGRLANGRRPLCSECGSLERHRVLHGLFKRIETGFAKASKCLLVGESLRLVPTNFGSNEFIDSAAMLLNGNIGKYDVVVVEDFFGKAQHTSLERYLSALVSALHGDSSLIVVHNGRDEDVQRLREELVELIPGVSSYGVKILDTPTQSPVSVTLLTGPYSASVVNAFFERTICLS